jgi:hypothetical protein
MMKAMQAISRYTLGKAFIYAARFWRPPVKLEAADWQHQS